MAIAEAKQLGYDCVLVDTAGRMQNNGKLMQELAKLVHVNMPNMLLFVGEALVGHDGIDQLNMFNKVVGRGTAVTMGARRARARLLSRRGRAIRLC